MELNSAYRIWSVTKTTSGVNRSPPVWRDVRNVNLQRSVQAFQCLGARRVESGADQGENVIHWRRGILDTERKVMTWTNSSLEMIKLETTKMHQ